MKTFKLPCAKGIEFTFTRNTYADNNNTYIGIVSRENGIMEPYDDLTVNLGSSLPENMAYININHLDEDFLKALEKKGFITPTEGSWVSGFVTYPLYILNLEKMQPYMELAPMEEDEEAEDQGMEL